jgi:hypothetical protein
LSQVNHCQSAYIIVRERNEETFQTPNAPHEPNKERDKTMTATEFVTDILLGMMDPDELEQIVQEAIENGYDDDKELIEILDLLVFQNSAMKEFKQNYNAHAA